MSDQVKPGPQDQDEPRERSENIAPAGLNAQDLQGLQDGKRDAATAADAASIGKIDLQFSTQTSNQPYTWAKPHRTGPRAGSPFYAERISSA